MGGEQLMSLCLLPGGVSVEAHEGVCSVGHDRSASVTRTELVADGTRVCTGAMAIAGRLPGAWACGGKVVHASTEVGVGCSAH